MRTVITSTNPQTSAGPSKPRDNVPRFLGYDLNTFGPYGLQWMLECQVDDEVFRSSQSVYEAEKLLGHPIQALDHICDHHFLTNLERSGFVRTGIAKQRGRKPRCPCWKSSDKKHCSTCQSCYSFSVLLSGEFAKPDGVDLLADDHLSDRHPFLICRNSGTPTLFHRLRNDPESEVRIMRCLNCETKKMAGCDFVNGDVRLRLEPSGSGRNQL